MACFVKELQITSEETDALLAEIPSRRIYWKDNSTEKKFDTLEKKLSLGLSEKDTCI